MYFSGLRISRKRAVLCEPRPKSRFPFLLREHRSRGGHLKKTIARRRANAAYGTILTPKIFGANEFRLHEAKTARAGIEVVKSLTKTETEPIFACVAVHRGRLKILIATDSFAHRANQSTRSWIPFSGPLLAPSTTQALDPGTPLLQDAPWPGT